MANVSKTNKDSTTTPRKKSGDPLSVLEVFERLEVGPVKVESQRLVAPYKLTVENQEHVTELIYRYEEPVFDPAEPESQNLANMIAAQVAMNYGLFCKAIYFYGRYESADVRFIQEAAENTAREVYVNKLLQPNPFLVGELSCLPVVKSQNYLRAKLDFEKLGGDRELQTWSTSTCRCSILSSGGKDSLLTFGLMHELGEEVHPIFANESGRHWFTSLNAHRYFRTNTPNTARVWMNSDRVFTWMLRFFPFVRKDFQNVRSDEYPIRLWTVGVFLFGALPLLRKRGVGRLLIGDELDTTHRTSLKGIPHYNGLYDQSRYFDNFLTRYFLHKGWNIEQFSVLRPLSELLILKILAERYPELQRHQVSCHASHKESDRIKPCGKCEKCRRVVSMLRAIDVDPSLCGYTSHQVEKCLKEFLSKGVHQEQAGIQHLKWLLAEKNLIPLPAEQRGTPRPEVMSLRFDRERSPVNSIPVELRKPLYDIYLQHTQGAVFREGRSWKSFDPLSDSSLTRPYPFSKKRPTLGASAPESEEEKRYLLGHLTWPEAKKRLAEVDVALLPVGATEQHGPHLPLDTDAFDAEYLARQVARRCSDPKPIVLPLVPYGVSYHHDDFSGTISIGTDTLAHLVYEIATSAARNGIHKLVIINGHGGNEPALNFAAQMINRDTHIFVCVDSGETSDEDVYALIDTPNDVHAGEIETSTTLAVRPDLVQQKKARKFVPRFSSRYLNFTSKNRVSWYAYTKRISRQGVMGDPTKASVEKGEKIWAVMIEHLVAFVEDLKGLTLDEIYQRRY